MTDLGIFDCNGDIFKLIFGDQIHDFMGERILSSDKRQTRTEQGMITLINKAWKFYNLNISKEKSKFNVESYQNLSEKIISEYAGSSKSGKKLGSINKFKNLNVNNKALLMRYEEDLGLSTRLYIQKVCYQKQGINIQEEDYTADIHIDATKGKGHNFLTAMVNLPVTLRAVQGAGICSKEGKDEEKALQNYFKQIKFTPLLANIFDMASFNQLYKTSAAYYNEDIKIKNEVARFIINDSKGNTLEWELRNVPKFYNIAYWFVRKSQVRDFYNIDEVNNFITSLDINKDNGDDIYFLYSLMIDGFKNFIDKKIELSNKKTRTLKSVLKNAIKTRKVGTKEAYTFLSQKIKQNSIKKDTYKQTSRFILTIIDDILKLYATKPNKLKFYDIGCREVYINETYLSNIMFYSYITKLKLNAKDLTGYLFDTQKYLQGFRDPGASVKNIQRTISEQKITNPDYILTLLMLKSLGDLTIITNSFYNGIVTEENNINFFATFDRTAACIATTISYNDESLYPYVLLEQPGYGVGAYEPENLGKEFNVTDILKLADLEVIKGNKLEEYKNSELNCKLFKDKYLDSIQDEEIKQNLENLNCNNSYDENWDILEQATSDENAGLLSSLYSYFFN